MVTYTPAERAARAAWKVIESGQVAVALVAWLTIADLTLESVLVGLVGLGAAGWMAFEAETALAGIEAAALAREREGGDEC